MPEMCCDWRVNKCDILCYSGLVALGDDPGLPAWGFGFSHRSDLCMGFSSHKLRHSLLPKTKQLWPMKRIWPPPPNSSGLKFMLNCRSPLPTILLMTIVPRLQNLLSNLLFPIRILYPCLCGQEPESWTDCIWLLLKAAIELMLCANIICIENSVECRLNAVLL